MPNGTYGGVRGEKFTKNYPLLDCQAWATARRLSKGVKGDGVKGDGSD